MLNKYDILAFGEALIDFIPTEKQMYKVNPGGAPFNLAVCASKGGASTAFMGKVGKDGFGILLVETARCNGVSTEGMLTDPVLPTTHAFVTVDGAGENSFVFCRDHCADVAISPEEIDEKLIKNSHHFHFGGLSLAAEPCRSALYSALLTARSEGLSISFDPNYRSFLWKSPKTFVDACLTLPVKPNVLKVSENEALLLSGKSTLEEAMDFLTECADLVLLTMGARGAMYGKSSLRGAVPAYPATPKDTTGAGDIFLGSFLAGTFALGKEIAGLDEKDIIYLLGKSCEFAAKSTEKEGAIPSIPEISF